MVTLEGNIKRLEKTAKTRDLASRATVKSLEAEFEDLDQEAKEHNAIMATLNTKVENLEYQVQQRNREIKQDDLELQEKLTTIHTVRASVAERDTQLASTQKALALANSRTVTLCTKVEEKTGKEIAKREAQDDADEMSRKRVHVG
jgi:predicted RNase H-like nuclease (RuvC/YqgF family)